MHQNLLSSPNPSDQEITLKYESDKEETFEYELITTGGTVLKKGILNATASKNSSQQFNLPIADIKPGIYFLKLKTPDNSTLLKFVKQ
jgi:hypothetical protein